MKFLNNIKRIFGFKIDINNRIKEEKNNFQIFANQTMRKHKYWQDKQKLIKSIFNDVIKQSKDSIIDLYMHEEANQIQLSFGKNKFASSIDENTTIIENGSALVFSKACNGMAICSLYYANSNEHKFKKDYFIWKLYQNPKNISQNEIYKAISLLFTVQRVYSSLYGYNIFDLCQIWFCKIKTFCNFNRIYFAKSLLKKIIEE